MYHGTVVPMGGYGQAPTYRDVGPDRWGFTYRQFPDGVIVVTKAPVVGVFGHWLKGSKRGSLQGRTLRPGEAFWARVTKQIGEHPVQISRRQEVARLRAEGTQSYGLAPWVDTFDQIASGFTADPRGDAGQVTSTLVEAVPGIQATIGQLANPATLEAMARKLGKLKQRLRTTRDPMKRSMLKEQIGALEDKMSILQGHMAAQTDTSIAPSSNWVPYAIGGSLLVLVGAGAFAASRRR